MCGFVFEIGIDCSYMVSAMFDEELKVEVPTVAARCEAVRIAHETICDAATTDDQEEDIMIKEFF